jgi:hypothetical protein
MPDGDCDCNGNVDLGCGCNVPAALSYCEDTDGDGQGAGDAVDYCLADLLTGWVEDCSDLEPDCATNDTDECGDCDGPGLDVDGCCSDPESPNYNGAADCSNICGGNNHPNYECWDDTVVCGDDASECPLINTCNIDTACNYDTDCAPPGQNCIDDDACYFGFADAEMNEYCYEDCIYGCTGNCIATGENLDENGLDCSEVCGGGLINDDCGECGGNGCHNQDCTTYPSSYFDCNGTLLSLFNGLIPEDFNLHSIYPNPFNPVTNIIYGLPEHVNVQIIVYDLSGMQVETLMNGFQAPGYHSVNWNADNHPSGVYFVKIVAGDYISTRKLMLVK